MAKAKENQCSTAPKTIRVQPYSSVTLMRLAGRLTEKTGRRVTVGGAIDMLIEQQKKGVRKEICAVDELRALVNE